MKVSEMILLFPSESDFWLRSSTVSRFWKVTPVLMLSGGGEMTEAFMNMLNSLNFGSFLSVIFVFLFARIGL